MAAASSSMDVVAQSGNGQMSMHVRRAAQSYYHSVQEHVYQYIVRAQPGVEEVA